MLQRYVKKFSGSGNKVSKRLSRISETDYDCKHAYHIVRLLLECEQILAEGDLDLMRNFEILKSIRNGEWKLEEVETYFKDKERHLEELNAKSDAVPHLIREKEIKDLLVTCLEKHYSDVSDGVTVQTRDREALLRIKDILTLVGM